MASYYRSNAVYDGLATTSNPPFVWAAGNAWLLAYGDETCTPRLLVYARGSSATPDARLRKIMESLGAGAGLPTAEIEFDDLAPEILEVKLRVGTASTWASLSMNELRSKFGGFGLPVSTTPTGKYLNDRESSAYHRWQRAALGGGLTVSDMDLFRLDAGGGNVVELVELKRSIIALEKWAPYADDYRNFDLLLRVVSPSGIPFHIAYNVRSKGPPAHDDASQMRVFSYEQPKAPRPLAAVSFGDFVRGTYLTT